MDKSKKEQVKEGRLKLLIFLEDDNKIKNKRVLLYELTDQGITFKFVDDSGFPIGSTIFLPMHRVLKIKEIEL